MLNSAQHARSAASRLDDVIDRSALEQAKEGLGGRDMEEAAHLDSESKRALSRGERAGALHAIPTHTIVATIATLPDCFSVSLRILSYGDWYRQIITCVRYRRNPPFGHPSDSEMARNPNALSTMKALLFVHNGNW